MDYGDLSAITHGSNVWRVRTHLPGLSGQDGCGRASSASLVADTGHAPQGNRPRRRRVSVFGLAGKPLSSDERQFECLAVWPLSPSSSCCPVSPAPPAASRTASRPHPAWHRMHRSPRPTPRRPPPPTLRRSIAFAPVWSGPRFSPASGVETYMPTFRTEVIQNVIELARSLEPQDPDKTPPPFAYPIPSARRTADQCRHPGSREPHSLRGSSARSENRSVRDTADRTAATRPRRPAVLVTTIA